MQQIKIKLGEGGQIVIPPEFLQALGLEVGDTVILRLEERSLSDELIAERRLED